MGYLVKRSNLNFFFIITIIFILVLLFSDTEFAFAEIKHEPSNPICVLPDSSRLITAAPRFSSDRDTVYFGSVAMIRSKATSPLEDEENSLLGSAHNYHFATTWGPEQRITFFGDSISMDGYPRFCVSEGDIYLVFSQQIPGHSAPFIMRSSNDGVT